MTEEWIDDLQEPGCSRLTATVAACMMAKGMPFTYIDGKGFGYCHVIQNYCIGQIKINNITVQFCL